VPEAADGEVTMRSDKELSALREKLSEAWRLNENERVARLRELLSDFTAAELDRMKELGLIKRDAPEAHEE
jgi:hypothetical protein